jgi:sterol desaturase/sphingolipid hydroxylase (fatty acid hydroxylase superfamily)
MRRERERDAKAAPRRSRERSSLKRVCGTVADARMSPNVLSLTVVYAGLVVLGTIFTLLERRAPERDVGTDSRKLDASYWLFTPFLTGALTRGATFGLLTIVAVALRSDVGGLLARIAAVSPFATHPLPLAFFEALFLADAVGYASHRVRHRFRTLWLFHAVHHSAKRLDWLAAARMHPIDDLVDNVATSVPVLLLGFDVRVYALLGPFFLLHTILLHANLRWDFGPLRFVLASPAWHRLHHSREGEGHNFGGVLAIFDVILGTFRDPRVIRATEFGTPSLPIPESLPGQLAYPFRALRSPE